MLAVFRISMRGVTFVQLSIVMRYVAQGSFFGLHVWRPPYIRAVISLGSCHDASLALIWMRKKLSSKSPQYDPDEFQGPLIKTELACAPNMLTTAIRPLTTVIGDDDDAAQDLRAR